MDKDIQELLQRLQDTIEETNRLLEEVKMRKEYLSLFDVQD